MKKRIFFVLALFVSGLTAIYAQSNANSQEALKALVGIWEGSYRAGQGETGLTLTIYEEGGAYKAIFDFHNLPGRNNAVNGKYYMNAAYNAATKKYSLKGYEWIVRPGNYGFADLEGTLAGNVFSGSTYNFRVTRIDQAILEKRKADALTVFSQGSAAQQQGDEAAALFYLNQVAALDPSLAEETSNLLAAIHASIANTGRGTDARSVVAWRNIWIERLSKTEELFNAIFSGRGLPYVLSYSTNVQQGKINYQKETIELSVALNLRMNNEWVGILDNALQTVKKMDDELQRTGKRGEWGLNDWPNAGVTETNPFRNSYSGGGFDGVRRQGTQWKTDFAIVVEILNADNRVIGSQSIAFSPFFEIYCNNRNFYGNFIGYGGHGGTVADSDRAIRLQNQATVNKTIAFPNVKINDTSEIMTVRIVSVNGKTPANAGIQILPLSASQ